MSNPVEVLGILPTQPGPIAVDAIVQFDVRSLTALVRVVVSFGFDGFEFRDVAWNGDPALSTQPAGEGFEQLYSPTSTVETITDGLYFRYRFQIKRSTVWPESPRLRVTAYNTDGNEA